jgi:protein-tyrosine phosphatase
MGNICRSPTAEGVMRKLVREAGLQNEILIDSAGTHSYHTGQPPDVRSVMFAGKRGIDLSALRARQVQDQDFERFDLILAMDWDNLHLLQAACPAQHQPKLKLLMTYASGQTKPVVPDPYDGGDQGFEEVLDLCQKSCKGLLIYFVHK